MLPPELIRIRLGSVIKEITILLATYIIRDKKKAKKSKK